MFLAHTASAKWHDLHEPIHRHCEHEGRVWPPPGWPGRRNAAALEPGSIPYVTCVAPLAHLSRWGLPQCLTAPSVQAKHIRLTTPRPSTLHCLFSCIHNIRLYTIHTFYYTRVSYLRSPRYLTVLSIQTKHISEAFHTDWFVCLYTQHNAQTHKDRAHCLTVFFIHSVDHNTHNHLSPWLHIQYTKLTSLQRISNQAQATYLMDQSNNQQTRPSSLTSTRQTSTRANVPERPMPALQCTIAGPTSADKTPDWRTSNRKSRKASGDSGTPKSGHVV